MARSAIRLQLPALSYQLGLHCRKEAGEAHNSTPGAARCRNAYALIHVNSKNSAAAAAAIRYAYSGFLLELWGSLGKVFMAMASSGGFLLTAAACLDSLFGNCDSKLKKYFVTVLPTCRTSYLRAIKTRQKGGGVARRR